MYLTNELPPNLLINKVDFNFGKENCLKLEFFNNSIIAHIIVYYYFIMLLFYNLIPYDCKLYVLRKVDM